MTEKIYYMPEAGSKWNEIENTPEARQRAIEQGAMFFTTMSLEPSKNGGEPIRRGNLVFDFDCEKKPQSAFNEAKQMVEYLGQYDIDPDTLNLYASGGKGAHIEVPAEILGASDGHPYLPKIHEDIAKTLKGALSLKTLDLSMYAMRKGKMFRIPNVKRKNGKYKIPLTYDELKTLPFDEIDKLCFNPREINTQKKPMPSLKMVKLFNEAKAKIEAGASAPAPESKGRKWVEDIIGGVPEGERNDSAAQMAGFYLATFKDKKLAFAHLEMWNKNNPDPLPDAELERTFESIASKEAQKKVISTLGFRIEPLKKRMWPDGSFKWALKIKLMDDKPHEIELTTNELYTIRLIEQKIGEAINRAIAFPSKKEWFAIIDPLMKQATIEEMPEDETEFNQIWGAIGRVIKRHKMIFYPEYGKSIDVDVPAHIRVRNEVVIQNDFIYFILDTLIEELTQPLSNIFIRNVNDRRRLGATLRTMGFEYNNYPLDGVHQPKKWRIAVENVPSHIQAACKEKLKGKGTEGTGNFQ